MEELVAQLVEHSAFNRLVLGSSPSQLNMRIRVIARIAQSVEQRTENPRVASSNLAPGNKKYKTKQIVLCEQYSHNTICLVLYFNLI